MKVLGTITGAIMCVLGIYAFCVPFQVFLGIGWLIGILMAVHGIEMCIAEFSKKKKDALKCVLGILLALFGFILLFSNLQRFFTDLMIAYMAGAAVVVYGVWQIVNGAKNLKEVKGRSILSVVVGVISAICGIVLMLHPIITMISLGYVIAFSILMQGIDMIIIALSIKKEKIS